MDSFTHFDALPVELRLQIWAQALATRSVWVVTRNANDQETLEMRPVGSPPNLVGAVSYEARQALREFCVDGPLRGPRSSSEKAYWIDLDTTVMYLPDHRDVPKIIDAFQPGELVRLKHVALGFGSYSDHNRSCQLLMSSCPALRTLIVFWDPGVDRPKLEAAAVANLTSFLDFEKAFEGSAEYDFGHFRSLLLPFLGDTPPLLHVVTCDGVGSSGLLNPQSRLTARR